MKGNYKWMEGYGNSGTEIMNGIMENGMEWNDLEWNGTTYI